MDTRARVFAEICRCVDAGRTTDAIFAEERAALQRDIATLNKAWHEALSDRDATKAREAALREALEWQKGGLAALAMYDDPNVQKAAANLAGAIDAALAVKEEK